VTEKKLRLKVGAAIATGAGRNGGQETALIAINFWYHVNDMLPLGITTPSSQWGVTGNTSFDPDSVHDDAFMVKLVGRKLLSKEAAWLQGRKVATVASIVQAGIKATGLDMPDKPYGFNLPDVFPDKLYSIA
jgi:multimeric flavodoxin WrbA